MDYLWFIGGVIFGSIVANVLFYFRSKTGYLKIDRSSDSTDIYRIELNGIIDKKTKRFILEVKDEDLSHQ